MSRPRAVLFALCAAACSDRHATQGPSRPTLPPLALQPLIGTLRATAATMPTVDDATQRELRELADLALRIVAADARTANRTERSLLDHPAAWWVLGPALAHEQVEVRRRAAWLCGRCGQSILQLPLLLRLKNETADPETVLWVADALVRLGNDTGLEWIGAAMGDQRTAQQAGEIAIGICNDRGLTLPEAPTYDQLREQMQQQSQQWHRTGRSPRADVKPPAPDQLDARLAAHLATTAETPLRPIDEARYVLTRAGVLVLPLLTRTLAASEHYLRTMTLQVLAELGPVALPLAPQVMPLLGDPFTQSYAIHMLGEAGCTDAAPHLRARLDDPDSEIRSQASQALGLLRDQPSAPQLGRLLGDAKESADVRVSAAFALLCLGRDAAAEGYLAEREAIGDYHKATLKQLRERLRAVAR